MTDGPEFPRQVRQGGVKAGGRRWETAVIGWGVGGEREKERL